MFLAWECLKCCWWFLAELKVHLTRVCILCFLFVIFFPRIIFCQSSEWIITTKRFGIFFFLVLFKNLKLDVMSTSIKVNSLFLIWMIQYSGTNLVLSGKFWFWFDFFFSGVQRESIYTVIFLKCKSYSYRILWLVYVFFFIHIREPTAG